MRRIIIGITFLLGAVIAALLLTILLIATNRYAFAGFKTALILPEFIQRDKYAGFEKVLKIKPLKLLTPKPIVKRVAYYSNGQVISGDIWIPKDDFSLKNIFLNSIPIKNNSNNYSTKSFKKYPVIILTLGVEIEPNDSRNVFLADIISRLGIVTFIPDIPGLSSGRVILSDVPHLVSAYNFLEQQPYIDSNNIGFLSFCGASVLSVIAAEDPKINHKVGFVVINNFYYNSFTLYDAMAAGSVTDWSDKQIAWKAHPKTVEIINREHIQMLESPIDKQILSQYLVNVPEQKFKSRNYDPVPASLSAQLSEDGRQLLDFLTNKDANRNSQLIATLPKSVFFGMSKISAIPNIDMLKTDLFIIADQGNTFQPFTDSQRLVQTLPNYPISYVETSVLRDSFLVSDLSFKKAISEGAKIFFFINSLMLKAG